MQTFANPVSQILSLPDTCFHEMYHQFFANFRKGNSHTEFISRVNGVYILLSPDIVKPVLRTKNEKGYRSKIANFFSYEEFSTAYHHFHTEKLMTYFHTRFNTPVEAKLEDLSSQNLIIFNMLVSIDGHKTDTNKMKLYLFYLCVEKIRIDFGFVMCKFLFKLSTDSRRKLS